MRLGVRGKLFVVSAVLVLALGTGTGLGLQGMLESWLEARIERELLLQARTVRELVNEADSAMDAEAIDPIVDRAGEATGARVTVIAPDGQLEGDSRLDLAGVAAAENHFERPEVVSARRQGSGSSRRFSVTVGYWMLYVAVPWQRPDGLAVVRVALPLDEVEQTLNQARKLVLGAMLLALGLALVMSAVASHIVVTVLDRLVATLRRRSGGDGNKEVDRLRSVFDSVEQLSSELDRVVSELASERDRFGAVLDGIRAGVVARSAQGELVIVNAAARELLGLPEGSTELGSVFRERAGALDELLRLEDSTDEAELEFGGVSPRTVLVRVSHTGGGAVAVLHDITELRRLERMRRDFVANASHELRTPVAVLRANAETLLDGALEEPEVARSFVEAMDRHAGRLAKLLGDLLDLSRIEAGRYALDLQPVLLSSVLSEVVSALETQEAASGASIDVDLADDLRVRADAAALGQVLTNLIDNALKYSPEGGRVRVSVLPSEGAVLRLGISDQGLGIPEEARGRLFERFFRVDRGRSRDVGGTGLGLAIVKHLVQSMGGTVGMEPVEPTGSCFWVELPRP